MKNITLIFTLFIATALLVSCETYEDYDSEATVVGFTKQSININRIPEGGTAEEVVTIFASDVATVDRTFALIDLPAETNPTATDNYSYPATVLVPAGTREVEVTITAIDNSISPTDRSFFVLAVKAGDGYLSGGRVLVGLRN
jgi:hypothetical protein